MLSFIVSRHSVRSMLKIPDRLVTNREMFASMEFEPRGAPGGEKAAPKPEVPAERERQQKQLIHCMKRAIARSITNISMKGKERPLNPTSDFTIKTKMYFEADDIPDASLDADAPSSTSFTFTDYAPMCYQHLRQFFGIDAETFRQVLCHSKWHGIKTPGKSAAEIYFCGQNWVIKTMNQQESTYLKRILHRYYYHVRDNPHTLLPHFVGHHSITLDGGSKISFIIMGNVFATTNTIHEKFDLKGSTVGRFATAEERKKLTCTKKDLDLNHPLLLGVERRSLMVEQIRRDCDFLRKADIMDYSLLIGIHYPDRASTAALLAERKDRRAADTAAAVGDGGAGTGDADGNDPFTDTPAADPLEMTGGASISVGAAAAATSGGGAAAGSAAAPATLDGRCFTADQGGMLSELHPGHSAAIYYIGIIDILQEYNTWKASETLCCGIVHDRHQISSVDAKEYAARFVTFMSSIIT